ncbi:Gmad2 immunoglobulin-like domain-containing protein [candidate division KSB1 bacterium]
MKRNIFILVLILAVAFMFFVFTRSTDNGKVITNFEECIAAGNPAMESYPRQCNDAKWGHFVEFIGNELEKNDMIHISFPRPNGEISSPLTIVGEARGYWFFEGDFPIVLTDSAGDIIAEHYATAQGEWMTEDFVSFTSTIEFEMPAYGGRGALILKKDNPSGLSENDDSLEIPVLFKNKNESNVPVNATYGSHIVYTTDASLAEGPFVNDCRVRGGVFNSCGSSCAPDAEICVAVCAYTCELPQN